MLSTLSTADLISVFAPLLIALALLLILALLFFFMRPQRFYFIRHGETILNSQHIRQGPEGALSEKGRAQAKQVGQYLKHFPIKRIISSTYPRARETAEIINAYVNVSIVYSPFLVERRNSSKVVGKSMYDREIEHIVDQVDRAYHEDEYRFDDEENFVDLKKRAKICLGFLARRGAHETVIVTHHVFLKMLIAYLLYRERLHAADFTKLSFFNYSDNAGITVCEYHPWKMLSATRGWEVVSFNEQPN